MQNQWNATNGYTLSHYCYFQSEETSNNMISLSSGSALEAFLLTVVA